MSAQTASTTQARHVVPRVAEARSRFSRNCPGLLASAGFAAFLLVSAPALAATAPPLGSTSTYAIVSTTFTNGPNVGAQTAINGTVGLPAVCYTVAPVTPPVSIIGTTVVPCPPLPAPGVGGDFGAALANLNAQALLPSCINLGAGAVALDAVNLGFGPGVFPPGCYTNGGAMNITLSTNVTLLGNGVYIFKPNGALNTGDNSRVILAGGACASDVFWGPTATTIGAWTLPLPAPVTFVGTILDPAAITIGNFANVVGRALAFGVTVTTAAVTITTPTCAAFVAGAGAGGGPTPTLSEWAMIMLAALLAIAGFAAMRRRAR